MGNAPAPSKEASLHAVRTKTARRVLREAIPNFFRDLLQHLVGNLRAMAYIERLPLGDGVEAYVHVGHLKPLHHHAGSSRLEGAVHGVRRFFGRQPEMGVEVIRQVKEVIYLLFGNNQGLPVDGGEFIHEDEYFFVFPYRYAGNLSLENFGKY